MAEFQIAPKSKGVISQSVKEITEILVSEGLVQCEKIGTFVCYWAFPSQALQFVCFTPLSNLQRKQKIELLEQKIENGEKDLATFTTDLKDAKLGKEVGECVDS